MPYVKFYKFNDNCWKFMRQIETTDEIVSAVLISKINHVDEFYQYQIFSARGVMIDRIYTINNCLFD